MNAFEYSDRQLDLVRQAGVVLAAAVALPVS